MFGSHNAVGQAGQGQAGQGQERAQQNAEQGNVNNCNIYNHNEMLPQQEILSNHRTASS